MCFAIYYLLILQDGWTPLLVASMRGHDRIVELLIAAGADVNFADKVSCYQHTVASGLLTILM